MMNRAVGPALAGPRIVWFLVHRAVGPALAGALAGPRMVMIANIKQIMSRIWSAAKLTSPMTIAYHQQMQCRSLSVR